MPGRRDTVDTRVDEQVDEQDEQVDEQYDSDYDEADERRGRARTPAASRRGEPDVLDPEAIVRIVLRDISDLTGRPPSTVTALERDDDGGWVVEVEVVEERRIPSSGDMLAIYRAQLTEAGSLTAFRRISRYPRGKGKDEVA